MELTRSAHGIRHNAVSTAQQFPPRDPFASLKRLLRPSRTTSSASIRLAAQRLPVAALQLLDRGLVVLDRCAGWSRSMRVELRGLHLELAARALRSGVRSDDLADDRQRLRRAVCSTTSAFAFASARAAGRSWRRRRSALSRDVLELRRVERVRLVALAAAEIDRRKLQREVSGAARRRGASPARDGRV